MQQAAKAAKVEKQAGTTQGGARGYSRHSGCSTGIGVLRQRKFNAKEARIGRIVCKMSYLALCGKYTISYISIELKINRLS